MGFNSGFKGLNKVNKKGGGGRTHESPDRERERERHLMLLGLRKHKGFDLSLTQQTN